jgi:hypothetical protein
MLTPKVTCRVIGTCHPMKRTESEHVPAPRAGTTPTPAHR